jgi:hypothetical protein
MKSVRLQERVACPIGIFAKMILNRTVTHQGLLAAQPLFALQGPKKKNIHAFPSPSQEELKNNKVTIRCM